MTRRRPICIAAMVAIAVAALAGCARMPPAATATAPAPKDDAASSIPIDRVTDYMSRQRNALAIALQTGQSYGEARLRGLDDHALLVRLSSDALFHIASTQLRPEGGVTLAELARVLAHYRKTIVYVAVHTDSAGDAVYNQRLSDRRARAVVDYLAGRGVERIRVWPSGRGEREPIASNETTVGRRRNRRVDIVIKPIVRGLESAAYREPLPFPGAADAAR